MLCENTASLCCAPYCCCVTAFILYVFVLVLSLGLCCGLLSVLFSEYFVTDVVSKAAQPSRRVHLWSSARVENKEKKQNIISEKKQKTSHTITRQHQFSVGMARDSIQYRFKCRGSAHGWQKLPSELIKVHSDTMTFTCSFAALHTQEDPSDGLCVTRLASWHSLNCNYGTKSAPCFALANWPRHSIIAWVAAKRRSIESCFFFSCFFPPPPHWLCLDLPLCTLDRLFIGLVCFTANLTTCRWWNPCQGGFGKFWCAESSVELR